MFAFRGRNIIGGSGADTGGCQILSHIELVFEVNLKKFYEIGPYNYRGSKEFLKFFYISGKNPSNFKLSTIF